MDLLKHIFLNEIQHEEKYHTFYNSTDILSVQLHHLTDDGKRIKLEDLKKDLNLNK